MKNSLRLFSALVFLALPAMAAVEPCRIQVVDKENGWPVPLVQLTTTNHVSFFTDNAGVVAFDAPEFMGRETWLTVFSHGYELPADGFGNRGVRFTPKPGGAFKIELPRKNIAKRLGRLTGAGMFAESQKLGEFLDWKETGVAGTDTVQLTTYKGKLFWVWGDTGVFRYALGIFDTAAATSSLNPLLSPKPPTAIVYDYFRNDRGELRGVAPTEGPGPTWVSGFTALRDRNQRERLVATYSKIRPPLTAEEYGLAEWNDQTKRLDPIYTIWKKSAAKPKPPAVFPDGHPAFWKDARGVEWLYLNGPPNFKCPATYEGWRDPSKWQAVKNPKHFPAADGSGDVEVETGSIAWSEYRRRWILIFQQKFGKPSGFGEVWYAEGKTPEGPWGKAVKIVSHDNYTFYNVQIDGQLAPPDAPYVLFEGTYTDTFADRPVKTPRYDYNQMLYRLDLDDPALTPARLN